MFIDEEIINRVLKEYGLSLEDVIGSKHKTPKAEQDWIYLIHHMHPPKKAEDMETLHHCYMFEKKNLKGKKYEQMHVKDDQVFQHCLKIDKPEKAPGITYDHLNNGFKVVVKEINKNKYAVITGPVKLSDIRWSDQDRG
jgi:hypothetical protein